MKLFELFSKIPAAGLTSQLDDAAPHWDSEQHNKIFDYLKQNCNQILDICANLNEFLFRGFVSNPSDLVFLTNPRTDRLPKDSSDDYQNILNQIMTHAGCKALRHNSAFCTSDSDAASGYGKVYAVFPFDNFDFSWSRRCEDAWSIEDQNRSEIQLIKEDWFDNDGTLSNEALKIGQEFFDFTTNNLTGAIMARHEILLANRPLLAIEFHYFRRNIQPLILAKYNK